MRNYLIIPLILIGFFVTGCGSAVPVVKPFKMDIQQGNVVTSKMLLQLRPGMTKSQVKFIMGTPLIIDSFHSNRWDYFYQMRQAGKITEQRRVILEFDKDLLSKVRGDVVPQGTAGAETAQDGNTLATAKSITPNPKKEEGILDKLKFWKSDEPEAAKPAAKLEAAKPKEEKGLLDKLKFWKKDEAATVKETTKETAKELVVPAAAAAAAPSESSAEGAPSLLAVPISGVPALDAPTQEAPSVETTGADAPKVEVPVVAAPETVAPVETVPTVETPKSEPVPARVQEPAKDEPVIAAPVVAPAAEPVVVAPKEEPANAPKAPVAGKDEPFIFRMDKNLDMKNLEASPVSDAETKANAKKADTPPPPPEEPPGYFERILEKIGF